MVRVVAFVIMIDGLISTTFGHGFVRWLCARAPHRLAFLFSPFLLIPQPVFRAGALAQSAACCYFLMQDSDPDE
jgi:hypothetical protein